jgi:hypothetical protein
VLAYFLSKVAIKQVRVGMPATVDQIHRLHKVRQNHVHRVVFLFQLQAQCVQLLVSALTQLRQMMRA